MDFKFYLLVLLIFVVVGVIVNLIQSIVEDTVQVNSSRAVDNYDYIKYFKEDRSRIQRVEQFLVEKQREEYRVKITYTTPSGKKTTYRVMTINLSELNYVKANPTIVMRPEEKKAYKQVEKEKERALREERKRQEQAIKAMQNAPSDHENAALRETILLEQQKINLDKAAEMSAIRERNLLEREKALLERKKIEIELERVKQAGRTEREKIKQAERERTSQERKEIAIEKEKLRLADKLEKESLLAKKQHEYCTKVNEVIDYANTYKEKLVIKEDIIKLDELVGALKEEAYKVIKKAKSADSGEWDLFNKFLTNKFNEIRVVADRNMQIQDYYGSPEFARIKDTCSALMDSQKEFNEYIEEKAKSIATVFGSSVARNETEDIYKNNYFRPYKKTITPFNAELKKTAYSSAENDPIEYIIKKFYPDKYTYPEQIQRLQLLIGELETLKDAKVIIDNFKKDYQQYLASVPDYVMENDENGFFGRLGFADVSERALTIEYRFTYTSDGGMIQKTFSVPMTEENISSLINRLESKLTIESFTKEQRSLMTPKLRNQIKERDNYTCQECGNSTYQEPNLLLEIDHIRPISKGGATIESNLQTLCWKCNRAKSNKIT